MIFIFDVKFCFSDADFYLKAVFVSYTCSRGPRLSRKFRPEELQWVHAQLKSLDYVEDVKPNV